MDSINLESCIIEIKQAIARIEEQTKTISESLHDYKIWSEKLHAEHFQASDDIRRETAELHRSLDVRISKHDVDILTLQKDLSSMEISIQHIAYNTARAKGIAVGLGMAGGAIVSILTILVKILK